MAASWDERRMQQLAWQGQGSDDVGFGDAKLCLTHPLKQVRVHCTDRSEADEEDVCGVRHADG